MKLIRFIQENQPLSISVIPDDAVTKEIFLHFIQPQFSLLSDRDKIQLMNSVEEISNRLQDEGEVELPNVLITMEDYEDELPNA